MHPQKTPKSKQLNDKKNEYDKILDFKKSHLAEVGGVNYARVTAIYLHDKTFSGWLKKAALSLFYSTTLFQEGSNSERLIIYSCKHKQRSDYDFIVSKMREATNGNSCYVETSERLSAKQFCTTIKHLPIALKIARGYRSSLFHRISAALLIAKYYSTTPIVSEILEKKTHLISFCDAYPIENLATQLANNKKIKTTTNQHGQYRALSISNMSPDVEAYSNFISSQMLCWGEATVKELSAQGISRERFSVVGWIKKSPLTRLKRAETGTFGIMLNGENGRGSNISLIEAANEIASALNKRYIVRLHPLSRAEKYKHATNSNCISLEHCSAQAYANKVDFSIAHMSGSIIEMLDLGSPVYLLDDNLLANVFRIEGLSFSSPDEIVQAAKLDLDNYEYRYTRLAELKCWFNDDINQASKILRALELKDK